MEDKIILQMLDSLRSTSISQTAQLEASLFSLAWAKLSVMGSIPEHQRLSAPLFNDSAKMHVAMASFAAKAGKDFRVPDGIRPALELALKFGEAGVLQNFDAVDAVCQDQTTAFAGAFRHLENKLAIPPGVADLLVSLVGPISSRTETVYTPWDWAGQLAARVRKQASAVYLETNLRSTIAKWVSILAGRPFEVKFGDPIAAPAWMEGGKPRVFDRAVACPPFGVRFDEKIVEQDLFNRFPERTTSGSVLTVRQILSQARRRIVVAVQGTLLFSDGVEKSFREDLIKKGIVEAVIEMPSGLFTYTSVPFAILILAPGGGREAIKFINADTGEFTDAISKARNRLVNVGQLVDLIVNDVKSENVAIISSSKVLAQDSQLLVGRYVMPKSTKKVLALVAREECVDFGEIVETVRPMPSTNAKTDIIEAREIGAADLPPYGYISAPGRIVKVNSKIADESADQFLRPLDIVLIIKGSVGKVGIVPEGVPPPGTGGWIAGQSAIVLRVKKGVIDPRAVAVQIRSPRGQEVLKFAITGATIPLIPLKMLMKLPFFVPDFATSQKAAEALDQETQIQREIDRLRESQSEVARELWPL